MSTLYELSAEYQQLLDLANDPEIDEEVFADTLDGLTGEIEVKADGYARVMRQLEADMAAIESEEKRLYSRRKAIGSNIDRMKKSLHQAMVLTGKTRFKTELFSFGIRKNPPKVVMDEQYIENIPEEFLIPQEPKIDRKAIAEALKAGADLSGLAHLEQGESLTIR